MALSWSARRQLMYYGVGFLIALVAVWGIYSAFFNTAPTCNDGRQNGTELGIDCGGSCALVCTDTAKDPTVTWARAFQTAPGYYTAAAYIKNNNVGSGAKNVKYSFQLFDDKNSLVKEYTGTLDLPPIATIPVIVPNITVGNRTVTRAYFAFSARPVWSKVIPNKVPKLYVSEQKHSDDWTTVRATLSNTSDIDVANATAAVVLFDSENVARAASKSLVSLVPAHGTGEVVFTWPSVDGDIVRAEITVLPSF